MSGSRDKSRCMTMKTSTANKDEVAQFTRLAEKWWDPGGEFRALHQLNPVRLSYIKDKVCTQFGRDPNSTRPLEGLNLIDVGCGGGLLTEPMCRLGATVTGIDAGAETIQAARHHANQFGLDIDYRLILPEDITRENRVFDIVLNMEVIEHVSEPHIFLEKTTRLVKPGGAMILSTLNRTIKSLALAKITAEYVLRWVPIGTHDWLKFMKPSEIANELLSHGMKIRDIKGFSYDPLGRAWRESKDLKVNFVMFTTKF